jgi:hypothetical protein
MVKVEQPTLFAGEKRNTSTALGLLMGLVILWLHAAVPWFHLA